MRASDSAPLAARCWGKDITPGRRLPSPQQPIDTPGKQSRLSIYARENRLKVNLLNVDLKA